jgi:hypothetical protein
MVAPLLSKKTITRLILCLCLILFWMLWSPESWKVQVLQYFLLGNIVLFFVLMESLPIILRYKYRRIIHILEHFADSYEEFIPYSYTPVVVIRQNIHNTTHTTHLAKIKYLSDRVLFTLYHDWKMLDFRTDLVTEQKVLDLISVIIYYLQKDIPYEILHHHSKRIGHILSA